MKKNSYLVVIHTFLYKLNIFVAILVFVVVKLIINALYRDFYNMYLTKIDIKWSDPMLVSASIGDNNILLICVAGPLLETFFIQYLPIVFLQKIAFFKHRSGLIALLSAIFFGLIHDYSLFYIVHTFFIGLYFAYIFLLYQSKKMYPFWVVSLVHGLYNFGAILATHLGL